MNMEISSREGIAGSSSRLYVFSTVVVIGAVILLMRLWYLQILNGDEYRQKSENNRVRIRPVQAGRGMILDRYGKVMVDNRPAFDVFLLREDAKDFKKIIKSVGDVIKSEPEEIEAAVRRESPLRPVRIKKDIDRDTLAALLTNKLDLPGITVSIEPKRSYIYGAMASHLFGHIGEITEKQLDNPSYADYRIGSLMGKSGLELKYETYLKGVDGGKYVEVDASGRELSVLKEVEAMRALQWLSNKNILNINSSEKEIIELDINGILYLKDGLPEKRLLNVVQEKEQDISEAKKKAGLSENEINVCIGLLKNKNAIELVNKKIRITSNGKKLLEKDSLEEKFLKKLPLNLSDISVNGCLASPTDMNQCKNDGWKNFEKPPFKNQGDCVSYVQSNPNAVGNKTK